ncbi:MAG: 6-bladed beta-propeller [Ignavibacteriae bacterium]|nr:6-bladed beta-propeller [Ignavibacteriota bacterium]NOG97511.1 6-bladed beta-propeller [Ignavibacteriota bacterium]
MKNKNMQRIFILYLLSILTLNCTENDEGQKEGAPLIGRENEKIIVSFGKSKKELHFAFNKIDVEQQDRIWKNIKLDSKFKIGGIESEIFLYPSRIRVDNSDNFYVLDNMDCSVSKFDKKGNFIIKYGKKGRGPGEFQNPFDFDVLGDGTVAMCSPNDYKFVVFKEDEIFEFKGEFSFMKICFVSPNEVAYFQMMDPVYSSPFGKANYKTDKAVEYDNIFQQESFSGEDFGMLPFLIGDIHSYNLNRLVYISSIMGYVILFKENGKIDKVFKLIDEVNDSGISKSEERIKSKELQLVRFPKLEEYLFLSSNIYGDKLYLLNNQVQKDQGEFVIDIYSLNEGSYECSVTLKGIGDIKSVYFTDNNLFVVKETTEVEVFNYALLEES